MKYIIIIIILIAAYKTIEIIKKNKTNKLKKEVEEIRNSEEYINEQKQKIIEIENKTIKKENTNTINYRRKYLLTKNEYYFYKRLKTITDKYNLQILAKIRLADLVDICNTKNNSEYMSHFGKIKSKHIDFAISKDMNILAIIELQDNSHYYNDRTKRDILVNDILNQAGYKVFWTSGKTDIIEEYLNKNVMINNT